MTMTQLCGRCKNYFIRDEGDIHTGEFSITGGELSPLDFLISGQYFRIVGSVLNDGVYQYPATGLKDETFDGAVWAMRIQPDFVALCEEITAFENKLAAMREQTGAYQSESFGGYTYSLAADVPAALKEWQGSLRFRLTQYRRISEL